MLSTFWVPFFFRPFFMGVTKKLGEKLGPLRAGWATARNLLQGTGLLRADLAKAAFVDGRAAAPAAAAAFL